jgi:hypothetical protein
MRKKKEEAVKRDKIRLGDGWCRVGGRRAVI